MAYYTHHAKDRAFERYGFEISPMELEDIYFACRTGKALLARATDKVTVFIMQFRGVSIVPLLDADKKRIITFLPGDYFVKGQRMQYAKNIGTAKQRSSHGRELGRTYRRERITVRQALEEQ